MKVAVICEYSGAVRDEFIKLGHEAISFDILPSESDLGEHVQGDATELPREYWEQFDLAICHPPCTHIAVSGARHFQAKLAKDPLIQERALDFVRWCMDLPIKRILVENPVSLISSRIRPPDQIIQPWQFGDQAQKTTCLWLKNLPQLKHTKIVNKGEFYVSPTGKKMPAWYSESKSGKERSKTFPGIARAIAEQYGALDDEIFGDGQLGFVL